MKITTILGGVILTSLFVFSIAMAQSPSKQDTSGKIDQPRVSPAAPASAAPVSAVQEKQAQAATDQVPAAMQDVPGRQGATPQPVGEGQAAESQPPPDRRWILKLDKTPMPPAPKAKLAWKNQEQAQHCQTLSAQLLEAYRNVKYYSIRGDACSTAGYAERFLAIETQCRQECPENFLESAGYNATLVRNVKTLRELGIRRCKDETTAVPDKQVNPQKKAIDQ